MIDRTAIPVVVIDDVTGAFVQNAEVTIKDRNDNAVAVFQDQTGSTQRTQPLLTDAQGRVDGWLNRGAYKIIIVVPSRPTRTEYYDSSPGGDGAIDSDWIQASAITNSKLADSSVSGDKIANNGVGTAKIADNAVTTTKLPDGAVTTPKISDSAVTTQKIADGAITAQKLNSQLVTSDRVLHRQNIKTFSVGTTTRRSYIFPYPFPSANSTYYRDYYWFFGGATDVPVTLTNVSDKVTISVWTGGTSTRPGDVDLRVYLDGSPQGYMVENEIVHGGGYTWFAYPFTQGEYNSLYCSQTLTGVTPGTHTYNVKLTWSTGYPQNWNDIDGDGTVEYWERKWGVYAPYYLDYYYNDWYWWYQPNSRYRGRFISQGISLIEIKEEPNV